MTSTALTADTATKEDLEHLRNWLSSQHHLPPVSDKQLGLFLHSCHYHLETTKATIESYYTVKTAAPEFFDDRDPLNSEIQQIKNVIQLAPLPKKSPKGYKMLVGRLTDTEPSHFNLNSAIKFLFMVIDGCLEVEGSLKGLVYIFDMQGVVFSHLTRINLVSLKKYFVYSQEGMPVRLKAIHVLNVNPVISQIMTLIKPFLSKERLKLIHLHSGVPDEFLNEIPQSLLPSDYNGSEPPLLDLFNDTLKMLVKVREWFKEDEKLRVDEAKREKGKSPRNTFGIEGSFKKLDID